MEFKEMFKTEIYPYSGGYVACAVIRSNDFVAASTKPLPTEQEAREALASSCQPLGKGRRLQPSREGAFTVSGGDFGAG